MAYKEKKDTKSEILMVAEKLFLSNGFHETTVRDIAKEADVNPALISYHFKTKNNLGLEIYNIINDHIFSQIKLSDYDLENSIEEYYMSYMISNDILFKDPSYLKYYVDMHRLDIATNKPLQYTYERTQKILREYKISISMEENYTYLVGMKAIERKYLINLVDSKISMTLEELTSLPFKFYCDQLGFSDEQMRKVFNKCNNEYKIKYFNNYFG